MADFFPMGVNEIPDTIPGVQLVPGGGHHKTSSGPQVSLGNVVARYGSQVERERKRHV